jgi:hypothetical protein
MPSPTKKRKLIRKRKNTASGARRKREIRRDYRAKVMELGRKMGLDNPEALANVEE